VKPLTKGKRNDVEAAPFNVASIVKLYAQGRRVEAIHKCREIALLALPGHAGRLQAWVVRQKDPALWSLPRDESRIESFLYRQVQGENDDAAAVIVWCAKWSLGLPDTHSEGRGNDRRTVVDRGRDDFADLAFIALRRLVGSGGAAPGSDRPATHFQKAAAASHARTTALHAKFDAWCTANCAEGMKAKRVRAAFEKVVEPGEFALVKERRYEIWLGDWKKKQSAHAECVKKSEHDAHSESGR
jgi:hypothetical protein